MLFVASLVSTYSAHGVAQNCGQSDPEKQRICERDEALKKEYADFEASYPARLAKVNLERRAKDLESIRSSSQKEFCGWYGALVRGQKPKHIFLAAEGYGEGELLSIFKKQSKLRKLSFDDKYVKNKSIRIGMTTCMLYAAMGDPRTENRTTGSWGQHIQHVYGDSEFVYSENGRVTAWQD
jgi:hypothetical protein